MNKLFVVDWRKIGDFSAVGQLSSKIFSGLGKDISVFQFLTNWSNQKVDYLHFTVKSDCKKLIDWQVFPDAIVSEYKDVKERKVLYVRLSPHKQTLELAVKLHLADQNVPMIVHYMDKPYLDDLRISEKRYILSLYQFLINRASKFYTIHESSISDLVKDYNKEPMVLGNFIDSTVYEESVNTDLNSRKHNRSKVISIGYFGSIDQKMNATSIFSFIKSLAKLEGLHLTLYTNSGIPEYMKETLASTQNITVENSNLPVDRYMSTLRAHDFLLLPYNLEAQSSDFLQHSFSNKVIDYLESGSKVLAIGSESIPTISFCIKNNVALLLNRYIDEPNKLFKVICTYLDENHSTEVMSVLKSTNARKAAFELELRSLFSSPIQNNTCKNKQPSFNSEILRFLIKRNLYDKTTNQQSLSASISAALLKGRGYRGFDYEI